MKHVLTTDFDPVSAKAWKQKIQVDLKGADYNETLLSQTSEGITIKPFYHLDNFEKLPIPINEEPFKVSQSIEIFKVSEANEFAKKAANSGVECLRFYSNSAFEISTLTAGISKEVELQFVFRFLDADFIHELNSELKEHKTSIFIDSIGKLARTGNWFSSKNNDLKTISELLDQKQIALLVDTSVYQNAGANNVQQIAYGLNHAVEYFTELGADKISSLHFEFSVGNNYFMEISKFRAFKYIFQQIVKEYDKELSPTIFASPTRRNKTLYDYNVNLLRSTTECMSAILGGVNYVSNIPYDTVFKKSNDFSYRIAKNQLLILKEESYFNQGDSITQDTYFIESLTKQLAEKSLDLFKDIEAHGGFLKKLFDGTIQRKIRASNKIEQEKFDSGELVLLGTNKFPNKDEKLQHSIELPIQKKKKPRKTLIVPISPKRIAYQVELKRLQDEA